jgi:5-methyltetrahydrofolate--homocysteine methyltransferase
MTDRVYELAISLKPFETEEEIKRLLASQQDPDEILGSLRRAMLEACKKYEAGEFSLPHLSAMTTTFSMGWELLKDRVRDKGRKGKILVGTLGSVHYIGKDIIKFLYMADGFEVLDAGENAMAGDFIEDIREFRPDLVAVSLFLTNAVSELGKVVEFLEANRLRETTKIIVGGVQGNPAIAKKFRLDGWGHDPAAALALANQLVRR